MLTMRTLSTSWFKTKWSSLMIRASHQT
jgi:hypothetical protein